MNRRGRGERRQRGERGECRQQPKSISVAPGQKMRQRCGRVAGVVRGVYGSLHGRRLRGNGSQLRVCPRSHAGGTRLGGVAPRRIAGHGGRGCKSRIGLHSGNGSLATGTRIRYRRRAVAARGRLGRQPRMCALGSCTTPFLSSAIRLYEGFGFRRTNDGPQELLGTPLFTMKKKDIS